MKIRSFVKDNLMLIVILAVAVFLRFYQLDVLPPGLHPDEAANGLDIIRMIDQGDFQVIYDTNGPREALFFYLQGFFVWLGKTFGIEALYFTPLALRVAPALIGVFTVYGIYLLGKEMFNRNVGLLAAAFLAVSTWHVHFSRNGFRAIMAPLALVFLFYFFFRAYKNEKTKDFILAGASLALGFYTYLSFRFVPVLLIALLGFIFIANRKFLTENIKNIGYFVGVFVVAMIPMFLHFINVPADIIGRASTSIFNEEINQGKPLTALGRNIIDTLLMFNVKGDANYRHNVASFPMLDILAGIAMWVGVIISFVKIRKIEYFFLLISAAILSLPEVVTAEGIPHALRMVAVIPAVFLFAALGLEFVLKRLPDVAKKTAPAVLVVLVVGSYFTYLRYFMLFPTLINAEGYNESKAAYAGDMVLLANTINNMPENEKIILIVGEYGTKTIEFISHDRWPGVKRYELYGMNQIDLSGDHRIFVQKDWKDQAKNNFQQMGVPGEMIPVFDEEGELGFYEYK